jgi:hypothetical protein
MTDFRVLLVEDEPELNEELGIALRSIPYVHVDQCRDVTTARTMIEAAYYDAAVLDFRLPLVAGGDDPVDESLCLSLRGRTAVVHITAHRGDEAVERHIKRVHPPDEFPLIISKGFGFTDDLVQKVRQLLPARRIKSKLAMLDPQAGESGYARRFRPDGSIPSVTSLLTDVCADIAELWKDLHPVFQAELRESFDILDDRTPIEVYSR